MPFDVAVEPMIRSKAYPGGVYWVNAANDWQGELAALAERVGLREDGAELSALLEAASAAQSPDAGVRARIGIRVKRRPPLRPIASPPGPLSTPRRNGAAQRNVVEPLCGEGENAVVIARAAS